MHRARERLVRLARAGGIKLRQSYVRVDKFALIKHQRYAHPKQFKRANKALRRIRTLLGRVIRDVRRKIADNPSLGDAFALPLSLAYQVRDQRQRQRGKKIYSLHAPEVECIGFPRTLQLTHSCARAASCLQRSGEPRSCRLNAMRLNQ